LYFNADYFRAAGLDPENPPTTFDELLSACEAILSAEIDGVSACINWPLVSWFPEQWLAMQDTVLLDNDNGRSGRATEMFLTTQPMVDIVTWWKEMADRGYYTYSGRSQDYTGEAIIFIGKSTAMHINSTAGLSNFISFAEQQEFELGVAPLPRPSEDADNGLTIGGSSLFISTGLSEAETQAALDLVFFLTNAESDALFHQDTGYLPNRASTIDALEASGFYDENPFFRIGIDQMLAVNDTIASRGMVLGTSSQARPMIEEAIQSVIDGGEDPTEALTAAKARIDADIADYNSLFD
jgi:sn-glycerol 3-phosphate transport system substrate-binding protein